MWRTIKKSLRGRVRTLQVLFNLAAMFTAGFYVNLLTTAMTQPPGATLWESVKGLSFWNLLVLLSLIIVVYQPGLEAILEPVHPQKREVIRAQLEATARALAQNFPTKKSPLELRAFCHIVDSEHLVPLCTWRTPNIMYDDQVLKIPLTDKFLVVTQAFREGRPICRDVQGATIPGEWAQRIWPAIHGVLAAPIRDFEDPDSKPIGTIAFDSSRCCADVHFDKPETQTIIRTVAMATYLLLKGG